MKTLTLFRHAKSGWDDPVARDFDRGLNPRGIRGATLMGRHMRDAGINWDYIISSPAVRCVETLDAFWEGYGKTHHPVWDRRIYLASCVTLLEVIHDIPDSADHAMLCGHNPGIEDLVLMLVPDRADDALRDAIEDKFPTAAAAEIMFDAARWADVRASGATLTNLVRPRDLDPALGPGR